MTGGCKSRDEPPGNPPSTESSDHPGRDPALGDVVRSEEVLVVTLVPPTNASPAARLRSAILSVHAYVESHRERHAANMLDAQETLRRIPRMELGDALKEIKNATDDAKNLRIQRLAVRLLAHTRHEAETKAGLAMLLGDHVADNVIQKVDSAAADNAQLPPEQVASQAYATTVTPSELHPYKHCTDWQAWSQDGSDTTSNDISLVVTAHGTPSSFQHAREGLDPQSWGGCSVLWTTTDLVTKGSGTPPPLTLSPQTLGTAWPAVGQWHTLHEIFVCDDTSPPEPCHVELLINVMATEPSTNSYRIGYEKAEHYPKPPTNPQDVFVVTDQGHVLATETSPGVVDIYSTKTFGFAQKAQKLLVLGWLYAIEEQSYLGELICCF